MDYNELEKFYNLSKSCNSEYSAAQAIANEARRRSKQFEYSILDSEMITWVISGKQPAKLSRRHLSSNRRLTHKDILYEELCYIDDESVKLAVKSSIELSIRCNRCIYLYCGESDEDRRARIRVIVNMIWLKILDAKQL